MQVGLLVVFLLAEMSESRAAAQSPSLHTLFKAYPDHATLNAQIIAPLSGVYRSLIQCAVACAHSDDCSALGYEVARTDDDIYCTMFQLMSGQLIYLASKPGYVYLQDTTANPVMAITLNLTEHGATCSASSTTNASTSCSNLWDGERRTELGTEWISRNEDVGGWVEIRWNSSVELVALMVWNRCWRAEQCSKMVVEFNRVLRKMLLGSCAGGSNWQDCASSTMLMTQLYPPISARTVNITCMEDCEEAGLNESWGLQEVILWKLI